MARICFSCKQPKKSCVARSSADVSFHSSDKIENFENLFENFVWYITIYRIYTNYEYLLQTRIYLQRQTAIWTPAEQIIDETQPAWRSIRYL